jgi:alkyldihydroxyacetonephosphate synthase
MRAIFQSGLRPAVARLYDPFDAMLAKRGAVKPADGSSRGHSPGRGGAALRAILKRPALLNDLLHSGAATRALGGAMLVVVFEGSGEAPRRAVDEVRGVVETHLRGSWEGPAPAERWLDHRYAVSYRQAPVFANGAFVDTMEVAASWSNLGALYDGVRRALGEHVFVMAHFSHAYPDGCCIYFSFAGSARGARGGRDPQWDDESEIVYDRAWRAALRAAVDAGGTLAHHHGVGRSKAPRLPAELGAGIDVVQALMRAFDPDRILNPGNLVARGDVSGAPSVPSSARASKPASTTVEVDPKSLLARVGGATRVADLERRLEDEGLTLDVPFEAAGETVGDWLARGAPGARDRWLDPVDQLLAGLEASLVDGRVLRMRPAPRRAVGPDLSALFVGAGGRFGRIETVWLRVHPRGVARPVSAPFRLDREPPVSSEEARLLDEIAEQLGHGRE